MSSTVGIIGSATMGAGIAQVAASACKKPELLIGVHFFNPASNLVQLAIKNDNIKEYTLEIINMLGETVLIQNEINN